MWFIIIQNFLRDFLLTILSKLYKYFDFCPGHVNRFDTWRFNYMMKYRFWRIPQLCNSIQQCYGNVVEMKLLGQRVVVISDMKIASKVMNGYGNVLKQRFGNQEGLENLNMNLRGLIWNNDMPSWIKNRNIFESILNRGTQQVEELSRTYFQNLEKTIEIATPMSMLAVLRNYTVSMTMEGLFGISTTIEWRQRAIQIVGNYFKAWEFFLLTPQELYCPKESGIFKNACCLMLELSQEIYDMAMTSSEEDSGFISALESSQENSHIGVLQCIAEMLLAGTDTSSLTMFYTTLFLADHPQLANQVSQQIAKGNIETAQKNIMRLYYESMRMIPVGPVILRQAEEDIHEKEFFLRKGEGIIFNIAGMNRGPPFLNPAQFDPSRYNQEKLPLSFGLGKKSCVGRQFAEKEMKIFFTWFLGKYTILGGRERMVDLLQTRWDIANCPVNDVMLSIFPRSTLYLVGPGKDQISFILNQFKLQYPHVQIGSKSDIQEFSIVDLSLEVLKDKNPNSMFQKMSQELIIYFPDEEKQSRLIPKDRFLKNLEKSECNFHLLREDTTAKQFSKIMSLIANKK